MTGPPRAPGLDNSLALLREGYEFIGNRCRRLGTDVFETRLLGQRTVCMTGADAARVFYDNEHMQRAGAMPGVVKNVLLGKGGVQGLDGPQHRQRKAMFMELMSRPRLDALAARTADELHRLAHAWVGQDRVVLLDDAEQALWRAVCGWTGVPLAGERDQARARDMDAMVIGGGSAGLRHLQGLAARRRSEAWAAGLVEQVRDGRLEVPPAGALARIAEHREVDGERLSPRIAAVELLSVLRTTVALKYYVVFVAHALNQFAEARAEVVEGGDEEAERFVQEVRRFYPFFPFVAARVGEPFVWREWNFPARRRVLLDLYGTTHDARLWPDPHDFRPARFAGRPPGAYDLIPQGGGSHDVHHRCAGEWLTIDVMKTALRFFTREMVYQVPRQDLTVPLDRFPTAPRSGFVIMAVRPFNPRS